MSRSRDENARAVEPTAVHLTVDCFVFSGRKPGKFHVNTGVVSAVVLAFVEHNPVRPVEVVLTAGVGLKVLKKSASTAPS